MAELSFKRREVKAERIYFIPAGSVVDSVTVARNVWPDGDPATNYSDYELDDIETLKLDRETEEESFEIPSATDGYVNLRKYIITATGFTRTGP